MSFQILYGGQDVLTNAVTVATYINSFAKNLGIKELEVEMTALSSLATALIRPDFPHKDGLEKASPFKKAANFFVWFVATKPIVKEIPPEIIGPELSSIPNHQNVIFAYHMAADCLHGADLYKNGSVIKLDEKIKVSMHFFRDFTEAFSTATPVYHFKIMSLLFEQLAYKANDNISYDEIV